MKIAKSRRGFLFTIAAILLIVPLIYLISFYTGVSDTQMDDTVGKIRCDELHYFIEDTRRDMTRAVAIFGRRAAISAIDGVVKEGVFLKNYAFKCDPNRCKVDCSTFKHPENGSEAAIAELIVCGTFNNSVILSMENNTLPNWTELMAEEGRHMGFVVNITAAGIEVVPMDAWHFAVFVETKINASDKGGLCYYSQNIMVATSNASIIGLEDPLHTIKNVDRKYIRNCSPEMITPKNRAGCSKDSTGEDAGGGTVVFYSDIKSINNYCDINSGVVDSKILVIDQAFGSCNQLGDDCFNVSKPNHFGGVVDYAKNANFVDKCTVTIPWVSATGELDNQNPFGGGKRDLTCGTDNITSGDCVYIVNDNGCNIHDIVFGSGSSQSLNTSCYFVSDVNNTYNPSCEPIKRYPNGPSFFDRLDGNLNLSSLYVNQSLEHFGTSEIGLESFLNLSRMEELAVKYHYDIDINKSRTWVDYLYWAEKAGCAALGYCKGADNYTVIVDCAHAYKYSLTTDCNTGTVCKQCGDGACTIGENYVNCLDDCACKAGCPQNAGLTACKTSCGGPNCYDITYRLIVRDCSHNLMDLPALPEINQSAEGTWNVNAMTQVQKGNYSSNHDNLNKNDHINGSVFISESGCVAIYNITEPQQAKISADIEDC